jgi:uncharacterized protein with GYD domain
MRFLVIAQHPPHLCPTSNKAVRELSKEAGGAMPALAEKLGVKITDTYVTYSNHLVLLAGEADDMGKVRELLIQGRFVQWNECEIYETNTLEEALDRVDEHPAVF